VIEISRTARALTLLLALCLLVPTIGIAFQNDAVLEKFHNRTLKPWPDAAGFRSDPVKTIAAAEGWVADRVFPIEQVTHLQKTLSFLILRTAPEPRITLGKEGHIFLNGGDNQHLYHLFQTTCADPHSADAARKLQAELAAWPAIGLERGVAIDVVVVPVAASIYGDMLPPTVPDEYRKACLQRTSGESRLLSIEVPGTTFVYPLREMLAARGDDAFYPRGNWHPTGLSLKVVRDAYLSRIHATGSVDETLERGSEPAELLMQYDIRLGEPTYAIHNPHITADSARAAEIRKAVLEFFPAKQDVVTHVFTNTKPVVDQAVLMISDSYGDLSAEAFAGGFAKVVHVNANFMLDGRGLKLIDRVRGMEPVQRVLLLMQEGNVQAKLAEWAR
jgi:hypothetical protein